MPIYKKRKNNKKYLFWIIAIILLVGMLVSFSNNPVFTEVVLYP